MTGKAAGVIARSTDDILKLYEAMQRIRAFEEKAARLYEAGELPGFLHSSVGQEAVPVGLSAHLRDDDFITSTHRGHGHVLAKGMDPGRMFAELYARENGYNRGKGGSMHIMDFSLGVTGCNAIVGGSIPIACGCGLAFQTKGTDQVCVCYFGDGATNTGAFHEGVNLAAIWDLPVVYVCENNLYAESVPQEYSVRIPALAERAKAYGIPGVTVDGNDLFAVLDAAGEAVARARRGEGPTLLECRTYRWSGHFVGDPAPYRDKEELEEWKTRDPMIRVEAWLKEQGVDEARLEAVRQKVVDGMEEAAAFGAQGPMPEAPEALEDVYADGRGEGR